VPRRARLYLPVLALHVTQRGVNRGAVFVDDEDRWHCLQLMQRASGDHEVALHAYVLMGNHVHLLMACDSPVGVSAALRWLRPCCVQASNRRHRRTGTLWHGRFKSCLVDTDHDLLTVMRYIEMNPVHARTVNSPEDYCLEQCTHARWPAAGRTAVSASHLAGPSVKTPTPARSAGATGSMRPWATTNSTAFARTFSSSAPWAIHDCRRGWKPRSAARYQRAARAGPRCGRQSRPVSRGCFVCV